MTRADRFPRTGVGGHWPGASMPAGLEPELRFATAALHPDTRLESWRDWVRRRFVPLEIEIPSNEGFHAVACFVPMGRAELSLIAAAPQRVAHPQHLVRRSDDTRFYVLSQTAGRARIMQDGRTVELSSGGWTLVDTRRPYAFDFPGDFAQLVMAIPRGQAPTLERCAARLTAVDLCTALPLGPLVATTLRHLTLNTPGLGVQARDLLAESLVGLVCAAVTDACGDAGASDSAMLQLERVRAYVLERLRDPELSVCRVASDLGLSIRYVHKLFEREGTSLCRFVREQRLQGCRRDLLSERRRGQSVTEIAFSWGFNNLSHFSALFKRRFGVAPRELRTRRGMLGETTDS